jgi:hypothetical protein
VERRADPPGVAYIYAPDRKAERPLAHLSGFAGVLQVDGYAGYRALAEKGGVALAFCWSHVRRRFYELAAAGPAPIASEALERIASLYAIEKDIRGRSANERRAVRRENSRPILDGLEMWLREKLDCVSKKSKLAEAIRYALSRWDGLSLFITDGRVEIDSNAVERNIRPIALNRKNALFAGRMEAASIGRSSPRSSKHASSAASSPSPISPTSSHGSSTVIPTAKSTTSCHGPTSPRKTSKTWPENAAYDENGALHGELEGALRE